jgi:hypothetical protein
MHTDHVLRFLITQRGCDERLSPDLQRNRGKSIDGDLDIDE